MNTYSLLLLLGAANGFVLAGLIAATRRDAATRALAALTAVVSLRMTPYVLGYAGAYDAHRWLTFAPLDLSLAVGPLLWTYVVALTTGAAPRRIGLHLAPAAAQLAYSLACFALPLRAKWAWYTGPHLHAVEPAVLAATLVSLAAYLWGAWRRYSVYQAWLADTVSNREELRLTTLRWVLAAFAATLAIAAGFAAVSWLAAPLDYFDRFPLMLWLAGLVYVLGLAGWRQRPIPHLSLVAGDDPEDDVPAPAAAFGDDAGNVAEAGRTRAAAAEAAAAFVERLRVEGWWRDEGLTLALLARHLGTSPRRLSRVLNEGLGQGFNEVVNRLRVEAVRRELAGPRSDRDLLAMALDAGFSSKASFNRAFKAYVGCTPSQLRRTMEGERLNIRQSAAAAQIAAQGADD